MHIQLIEGAFTSRDAIDMLGQMIQIKIRYHEGKITGSISEEDIQHRETRIRELQQALVDLQKELRSGKDIVHLSAGLEIAG